MHSHRWFPFIVLGLLAVLIGLFVIIFDFQQLARTHTQTAKVAFNSSIFFQQATYLAVTQELDEQKYLVSPSQINYENLQIGEENFTTSIKNVLHTSANHDAALDAILATQEQYLQATGQIIAALNAHHTQLAIEIDAQQVWPLFMALQNNMDDAATKENSQALSHMDEVVAFQDYTSTFMPFVCGVSFFLLVVMGIILYRFQRSLTRTQQHEINRFKQSSLTDNLTQLGNHRHFQETYQHDILATQQSGKSFCLALIDVDEFKQYNDTHGHTYGDHILKTLAGVLNASRSSDLAFRLGGDEFALILRDTAIEEASQILQRLRASVQQQLAGVTISIGIAMLQHDADNAPILKDQADAALYEAKRRGRNCLVKFPDIADSVVLFTAAQAQDLRDLLQEKQISIVFQPIWDFARQKILAFEALMRPDAKYHFRGPQEAFDIAERMGHLHDLDAVCCEAILANAHKLPPTALLFMNISPQSLEHSLFTGTTFVDALAAVGLLPERVVLEITERAIAHPEVVIREAKRLRKQGLKLALDDAGSGNSGLEILSKLAVDYVKIDRHIVSKANSDITARAVLAGITAIARETNSYVIAEGIENVATLEFLTHFAVVADSKVHGGQGYLLGRPSAEILNPVEMVPFSSLPRAA